MDWMKAASKDKVKQRRRKTEGRKDIELDTIEWQ